MFSSPSAQQPRIHSDIIQELLTELATIKGYEETDFVGRRENNENEERGSDQPAGSAGDGRCARRIVTDSADDDGNHQILETRTCVETVSTGNGALVNVIIESVRKCEPIAVVIIKFYICHATINFTRVGILPKMRSQDIITLHTRS